MISVPRKAWLIKGGLGGGRGWVPSCRKNWMAIQWSGCGSNQVIRSQVIFMNHEEELVKVFWNLACLCSASSAECIAWSSRIRFGGFFFFFCPLHLHRVQGAGCRWHLARVYHHCALCIASLTKGQDENRFATGCPYICMYVCTYDTYG